MKDSHKPRVEKLAINGAVPTFRQRLHVGRPNIGDRKKFQERVDDILDRKWLTNTGKYVSEFERRIAELAGVKHCVAMCNGTVALELAIKALCLSGEVILPSFTFIATAHALQWQGITPVFCDIDPRTHNIDPRKVEELVTPRTSAILGVHVWGRGCDVGALSEIAGRRGLRLLFDAAHGLGCSHNGCMIGSFGDAEVFSFHATKIVNCLEGGAVVTNDGELAKRLRLMKNFGFVSYDRTDDIGTNAKMDEISAAMGLTNLESLEEFVAINRRNYDRYVSELGRINGITFMTYDEEEKNNYQYIVLEIDELKTRVNRDRLVDILHAENVLARRYFYPGCHRMEPYAREHALRGRTLPETEKLVERVMCLPTGTSVGQKEIEVISSIVRLVIENADKPGVSEEPPRKQPK